MTSQKGQRMNREKHNRQKILIAADSDINRSILSDMLGDEFDILEAENGIQAITLLQRFPEEIVLAFLDIIMPEMDGFQVLTIMNERHWIEEIPVIMISAETVPNFVERAYELGATEYISRPFDGRIVRRRAINTIMLYSKQKKLVELVADQIYEKERNNSLLIEILSNIVEFRNGESGLHVLHIQTITEQLFNRLVQMTDQYHLTAEETALIVTASALHDIGKIAIPEEILNKPGKLTPKEYEIIKTHSTQGASLLSSLPFRQKEPLVKIANDICRWHHERYDGTGYPDGLVKDEIPISAQIVALADVYDALSSERVYKKAYSHEKTVEMILRGECGCFNPLLLQCLTDIAADLPERLKIGALSKRNPFRLRTATEKILRHGDLSVSDGTLRLMKHEKTKYQFFASLSHEMRFELTAMPEVLSLSPWCAHQLGLDEVILNPFSNEKILEIIDEEVIRTMRRLLAVTTPENPMVELDCLLNFKGKCRWCKVAVRSMWSEDMPPQNTGLIGKIIDIREE